MSVEFKPKRRADKDVISYFEFSGLRNDVPPYRFDATDLAVADNVLIDKSHSVFRRPGATKIVDMPGRSVWANDGHAFFASGQTLYELSASFAPKALRTNMIGGDVSFCQPSDVVYFSDGIVAGALTNTGWPVATGGEVNGRVGAVDGTAGLATVASPTEVRSWGIDPPALPSATIIAGDLVPGRYGITATYIRNDGQESGAPAAGFVDIAAGQALRVTVANSFDPGVIAARVYVTTPDGDLLLCYTEQASITSLDLTAAGIGEMNEPLMTQFLSPPPAGHLIAYYKGHMFVAQDDVLYPSEPYAYELFDLRKFIRLDSKVTMLCALEDRSGDSTGFFIGTEKTCGILAGGGPDTFQYIPKTDYGAVPGACTRVDGNLYADGSIGARMLPMWLSDQGVCVGLPGLEVVNLTRSAYTFPIGAHGAALFMPGSSRFIAVSTGAPAISMDTEVQALTTYSAFDYNSMTDFAGRAIAASNEGLFELTGDTDNGAPIAAQVSFGITDFGSSFMKGLERMYVGLQSTTPMNVEVKLEDKTAYQYVLDARPDERMDTQRVKTGKALEARYWQFTLRNQNGGDFRLDVVDVQSRQMTRRLNGRA